MKVLPLLLVLLGVAFNAKAQTPADDPHWELIVDDNFDFFDTTIWYKRGHYDHYGEPQVYLDNTNNIFIDNGKLVIKIIEEQYTCPDSVVNLWGCNRQDDLGVPYEYTSGSVEGLAAYNKKYGYLEARIRADRFYGSWPAFWTFKKDTTSGFSNGAEIDIMENNGHKSAHDIGTNIHLDFCPNDPSTSIPCPTDESQYSCLGVPCFGVDVKTNFDYSQNFHVYAVEWTPAKIIWYIDGVAVRNMPNPGVHNFIEPRLNMAIIRDPYDNAFPPNFPYQMEVDYFRYYSKKKDCLSTIDICQYDFSQHVDSVRNEITIGQTGCVNALTPSDKIYLRASKGVSIAGDFTVPLGATFFADANQLCDTTLSSFCANTFNPCTYNFFQYANIHRQEIDIGLGSGCSNLIQPNSGNIHFKTNTSITIRDEAELNPVNGNSIILEVAPCQ